MKKTVIIVDENCEETGRRLETELKKNDKNIVSISTKDLEINTCYSCGYCSTKEYGKCFQKDDMEPILRELVTCDTMVVVTPVTFGSYSSAIKAIIERTCVLGDTHYYVVKGEMVKGMRSDIKYQYVVGIKQDCGSKEQEFFHNLVAENVRIMNIQGKSWIISPGEAVEKIVEEICHE